MGSTTDRHLPPPQGAQSVGVLKEGAAMPSTAVIPPAISGQPEWVCTHGHRWGWGHELAQSTSINWSHAQASMTTAPSTVPPIKTHTVMD